MKSVTTTIPEEIRQYIAENGIKISFLLQKGYEAVKSKQTIKELTEAMAHETALRERWQLLFYEKRDEADFFNKSIQAYQQEIADLKAKLESGNNG